MKRMISIALILIMLVGNALAASDFNPSSFREAKSLALECFRICAFGSEYSSSTDKLCRWTTDIQIYVAGSPTQSDLETLDDFIMECTWRCPDMPKITRVYSASTANVIIYFVPLNTLPDYLSGYTEGNWGYFTYWYNGNHQINSAEIGIATDVTNQYQRNHIIREELFGTFGLGNDHYLYSDSIIYQPWTETQTPSEVDWLMLSMLYHNNVRPGMSAKEACAILENGF